MKILAARIKRRLLFDTGKWGRCPIYENELQRIWPLNEEHRKAKIEQFAKEYGFCLSLYKPGLCAIFEKERPGWAEKTQDLVVRDKEGQAYRARYNQVNAPLLNEFLKEQSKIEQLEEQVQKLTEGHSE